MPTDNNHARATERLARLASGFLGFGPDPAANINLLARLGGELLGAGCALYNRLDGGMLVSLGLWNAPAGFDLRTRPDGHICYDVIKKGGKEIFLVRDLPNSPYAKTDQNIGRYNLKTFVGIAVKCKEEYVGSLCFLYYDDFSPSPEDREFIGIISAAIGIEESRRKTEETRQYLESIINQSESLVFVRRIEPDKWPVEFVSENVAGILGYTAGDFLSGRVSWPGITHQDDLPRLERELAGYLKNGDRKWSQEYRLITKSGEIRWFRGNNFSVADSAGGSGKIQAVIHDITERKRDERELKERNDELTRFSYAVSHDLKSPLVTITTFLDYLEEDIKALDMDGAAGNMGYIRTAADKMCRLLKELQEFSRVGHNMRPAVEMPLGALLEEALVLAAGRISKRGIKTRITGETVTLSGDRQRLLEVFQNLFDNATKFMGGQPEPFIEAGVDLSGAEPVLFVSDNGIGIDPRHQAKIFGLFEKLDSATEGTGMGLALVRRIIEAHGGKIWVESEGAGKGTTFRFTLANIKKISGGKNA